MKRIILLIFTAIATVPAFCQTDLEEGDRCFNNGDYACAIAKYNDAFYNASGTNKQAVEIKLMKAKNCTEWINSANQAFANKNYNVAKDNYQKVFDSNPKDTYAKTQLDRCNDALTITLSVSKGNLSFVSSGGRENITVTTNANSYSIDGLPSWCSVQQYDGHFDVIYQPNTSSTTRDGIFTVSAGDKKVQIHYSQNLTITLDVSSQNLNFSVAGGTQNITVTTNANSYDIHDMPSWCTVQKYAGYFVVNCRANTVNTVRNGNCTVSAGGVTTRVNISQLSDASVTLTVSPQNLNFSAFGGAQSISINTNAGAYEVWRLPAWCSVDLFSNYFTITYNANPYNKARNDWFKVITGNKEVRINISQAANQSSTTNRRTSTNSYRCINCPKANYPWGFSIGYVNQYIENNYYDVIPTEGLHIGLRYEPLFKYGFGINTGVYYEHYFANYFNSTNDNFQLTHLNKSVLNIPLHIEYRLNVSKYFNLFIYGGASYDYQLTYYYQDFENAINDQFIYWDVGGGIRFNHFQINTGVSISDTQRKSIFSVSYMF